MKPSQKKYIAVLAAAVLMLACALIFIPNMNSAESVKNSSATTSGASLSSASDMSSEDPAPVSQSPETTRQVVTLPTSPKETSASSEETTAASAESTEPPTETAEQEKVSPDFSRVAFIGDSRTVFLGSGDERGSGLVPDDSLFATIGARLTQAVTSQNACSAGLARREKAVFWFGVNDVQLDEHRDDADMFVDHYRSVIDTYLSANAGATSEIVILSVVGTSVNEKDHYEGQEANIDKYNAALRTYCSEEGYRFLDLSVLPFGEEIFLEDHIHFTKEWYSLFVPWLISELGI